ncbi:MAG: ribonuclease P protein component [Bacteroidota bacterium]
MNFTFKSSERLKSRKVIERMFKEGNSFGQYPLRLVWLESEVQDAGVMVQFTVSVSKKKFPKAVQRNALKRKVKEAFRLNKHQLYEHWNNEKPQYAWMVIYVAKEFQDFQTVEKAMKKIIRRFIKYQLEDTETTL